MCECLQCMLICPRPALLHFPRPKLTVVAINWVVSRATVAYVYISTVIIYFQSA